MRIRGGGVGANLVGIQLPGEEGMLGEAELGLVAGAAALDHHLPLHPHHRVAAVHIILSPGIEPGYTVFPSKNNNVQFYLANCYRVKKLTNV